MQQDFDPYYRWLGIPPDKQPPNHYCLLGLNPFESDLDVIETAANRQMGHLRTYQTGPHSQLSQKLLNQVAAAKICLLNQAKKRTYDADLRARIPAKRAPAPPTPAPAPTPIPTYYDRLLVEAQAKLSQAEVRRLELQEGRRTKVALFAAVAVVGALLVLPVVVLITWSIVSHHGSTGSAVPAASSQGVASGPATTPSVPTQPAASGTGLVRPPAESGQPPSAGNAHDTTSLDPEQQSHLIIVPDSLIDK